MAVKFFIEGESTGDGENGPDGEEGPDAMTPLEWNTETEVQLFYAITGHKPVGVSKHFQMACIQDKLQSDLNCKITASIIWEHLDTMYDMQALDDSEVLPFPNGETDFSLPEEFSVLIQERQRAAEKEARKGKSKNQSSSSNADEEDGSASTTSTPASEPTPPTPTPVSKKRGWHGRQKEDGAPKRRRI